MASLAREPDQPSTSEDAHAADSPSHQGNAERGEQVGICQEGDLAPTVARWVIERSNTWMERCKIMAWHFERTLANTKLISISISDSV